MTSKLLAGTPERRDQEQSATRDHVTHLTDKLGQYHGRGDSKRGRKQCIGCVRSPSNRPAPNHITHLPQSLSP
ncbi:hypothetical protein VTJ04DRAFT_10290 [Mycothermus thermophilus]|uniref:uncharacterized protein n=1 Tax=Humicola insolens TaxID=85995 RepID=UPI003743E385